jgi:hypothetical protein
MTLQHTQHTAPLHYKTRIKQVLLLRPLPTLLGTSTTMAAPNFSRPRRNIHGALTAMSLAIALAQVSPGMLD